MPARGHPGPVGPDPAPRGARFHPHAPEHHHRLFRGAAGVHHRHRQRPGADAAGTRGDPPLHLRQARRRIPVEPVDALSAAGRGADPHRRVRQLQHRPAQARLPPGPGGALRSGHAVHRRHPLQLLAARGAVAGAAGHRRRRSQPAGLPVRPVLRADPQFPPLQLAADVPVRRLAGAGCRLPARPPAQPRTARRRHPLPAGPPACG